MTNSVLTHIRDAFIVAIFLATGAIAAEPVSSADTTITIAPQSLATALQAFSEQSGLQVGFESQVANGIRTQGTQGAKTPAQALSALLDGTGLEYRFINDQTVVIREKGSRQTSASASADSSQMGATTLRLAQGTENTSSSEKAQNSASSSDNSGNQGAVEEIVVTAQRREERLQDVPIAISVLNGEQLDASTSGGVLDQLRKIPAVATIPSPEGRSFMVIRGVAPMVGASPVGYYFDAVPVSFLSLPIAPDADVYDLQRIEVLKGPQGTGYGIGSTSGVVRVLTNDPDPSKFDSKGRVAVSSTQGGGTNYRADAAVNAPIIEGRLAVRGVFGVENSSGWIDRPNKQDANDGDATNIRLKIGGELVEGLTAVAGIWHSKRKFGLAAADDNSRRNVLYDETANSAMDIYSLVLKKDFNAFSLVSSASYMDLHADYFKRSIFTTSGNVLNNIWDAHAFSEEINLASNGAGPFKWTAGVIYRSIDDHTRGRGPAQLAVINTIPMSDDNFSGSDSYGAFGEVSYSFSQFEVLGGLRYSKEDRDLNSGLTGSTYASEASFDKVTPRLVLSWKPNPDSMTYLSYAEGFRSGILQPESAANVGFGSVDSDLLRNYELGNKATVMGGLLSWEVAVYYMDWQDVQQGLSLPTFVSGQITFVSGYANASSASGFGGEVSVTLRPTEGFQIGGSYSQNDLKVDADVLTAGAPIFKKGDRLVFSPKTTYGAFADYTAPVGADLEFQVGANLSHFATQHQLLYLGGTSFSNIPNDPFTSVGLNVGIGRKDGSRKVSLFVDNLTNEDASTGNNYIAASPTVGNPDEGLRLRPRTIGLQVEMKF